ncbi:hypothetical protein ACFL1X_07135 [Candidatus Hydrogenedentota bacterium]
MAYASYVHMEQSRGSVKERGLLSNLADLTIDTEEPASLSRFESALRDKLLDSLYLLGPEQWEAVTL